MTITFVPRLLSDATYDEMSGKYHRNDLAAGCAEWDATGMSLLFTCPCGCGQVHTVPVAKTGGVNDRTNRTPWEWDGNVDFPSLRPSVRILESDRKTEHWHGHLTNGEWLRC